MTPRWAGRRCRGRKLRLCRADDAVRSAGLSAQEEDDDAGLVVLGRVDGFLGDDVARLRRVLDLGCDDEVYLSMVNAARTDLKTPAWPGMMLWAPGMLLSGV